MQKWKSKILYIVGGIVIAVALMIAVQTFRDQRKEIIKECAWCKVYSVNAQIYYLRRVMGATYDDQLSNIIDFKEPEYRKAKRIASLDRAYAAKISEDRDTALSYMILLGTETETDCYLDLQNK